MDRTGRFSIRARSIDKARRKAGRNVAISCIFAVLDEEGNDTGVADYVFAFSRAATSDEN